MHAKPNEFHIVTTWTITADLTEVAEILADAVHLPDWWGAVYLETKIVTGSDARGIGRQVAVHSKGWLPYKMHWTGTLVQSELPHSWTITASGDLDGVGV